MRRSSSASICGMLTFASISACLRLRRACASVLLLMRRTMKSTRPDWPSFELDAEIPPSSLKSIGPVPRPPRLAGDSLAALGTAQRSGGELRPRAAIARRDGGSRVKLAMHMRVVRSKPQFVFLRC